MADFPTHRLIATDELVWPAGYKAADLEPLASDYWDVRNADEARTAQIAAIRATARAEILTIADLARQINDLVHPDDPGAIERRAAIDKIREKSNQAQSEVNSRRSLK